MNYEEMLNAQDGVAQHQESLPLGVFYRKQIGNKFRHVVDLKAWLTDSLVFCDGLRRDQQLALSLKSARQLRYELHEDSGGIYELELQPGNYQTLAQLLDANPAVVAQKGFIEQTLSGLMDLTEELHNQGVYHLCYAPQTVFVRKGDNAPLLLCHGSSFLALKDQAHLYEGFEQAVAPEVLAGEQPDERSDIFALGRLVEQLFASAQLPFEYKAVVKKATDEDPDRRFSSIHEMREAISRRRSVRRSAIVTGAALLLTALAVWLFFDLVPESSNVEFVDGNGINQKADPFSEDYDDPLVNDQDEYLDPEIALYLDSIGLDEMTDEEFHALADSVKQYTKVEEIFRRRFIQQAGSKLGALYSQSNLGSTESNFIARSQQVVDELMDYARKLGDEAGLPQDQAMSQASQIITRLQAEKQQSVTRYGSMTDSKDDEE